MTNQWMGRVSTIPQTSHLYSRIVVMIHHPRCREQHSKRPGFDKPSPLLADDFTEFAREDGPIPRTTGWPKKTVESKQAFSSPLGTTKTLLLLFYCATDRYR